MKLSGILGLRPATFKYITTGVAALGALAMSAQADAADMYGPVGGGYKDVPVLLPPPPLWTGFYAGVNMGAAWSNLDINRLYEPNGSTAITRLAIPLTPKADTALAAII